MNPKGAWHDGRLTVLDLETTGVDPETARIVTCAIGYVSGGRPTDIHTLVAIPDIDIPPEATAVHGWDMARCQREGRPTIQVLDIALGMIDRRPAGPVCVMNSAFDLTILDRETRRHHLGGLEQHRELRVVDPRVIDLRLDKYRKGSRRLPDLCRHYNARLEAAHTAGADAIAAGRLAWRLAKSGQVIRRVESHSDARELAELQAEWDRVRDDIDELHDAQIRWAGTQARQLARYFDKHGVEHDVVEDWPLIPYEGRQLRLGDDTA